MTLPTWGGLQATGSIAPLAQFRMVLVSFLAAGIGSEAPILPADMRIKELADRIARHDPEVSRHQGMLIVDREGKLAGVVTRGDILRALDKDPEEVMTVLEAGSDHIVVTYPEELLSEACAKMLRHGIGRLPVVDRNDPQRIVGYLGRSGIMAARLRRLEEEHVREPGWIGHFR
jgi:chloride channel protein, CIC family